MRLQLALNVDNLDEAIDFYTKLFNTEPLKVKPGYANWAIVDPPLKLVIFERAAITERLITLGLKLILPRK